MLPEAWRQEIKDLAEKSAIVQGLPPPKHHWYDLDHLTFYAAVAAAVFAGWLAWRTNDLAVDSNKQLISATRAWIVPTGARLDGQILLDHNQRAEIMFENVGKEAAWDVSDNRRQGPLFDVIIDAKRMPYIDVQTAPWPVNTVCSYDPLQVVIRSETGSEHKDSSRKTPIVGNV